MIDVCQMTLDVLNQPRTTAPPPVRLKYINLVRPL